MRFSMWAQATLFPLAWCCVCAGASAPGDAYRVGADDKLMFRSAQIEEVNDKHVTVAKDGSIDLPLAGTVGVRGLSVEEIREKVNSRLKSFYYDPHISVEIEEYASQPVSVLGTVAKPGVYQLRGQKSLAEVLAMAGGLLPESGYTVRVERKSGNGQQTFSYNLRDMMHSGGETENVPIEADDLVFVPRAQLVYVIGDVRKPGGFALGDRQNVSVLQSLALAEGPLTTAALSRATILRVAPSQTERKTIPVNVKRLMAGRTSDIPMQADDILVVPSSAGRKLAIRSAEVAAQTVSGVVIWKGL